MGEVHIVRGQKGVPLTETIDYYFLLYNQLQIVIRNANKAHGGNVAKCPNLQNN